jgi:hypothetical protein
MTKKQLLSEAQRRQFMKLAMIKPIRENWGMNEADEEMGMDAAPADDMGADMDMGGEEVEASASEGEVEITKDELDKFVDLASAAHELAQKLKGAVSSEEGEEMGEDEIDQALQEMDYQPSQEEVVNEVAKRVAKRLVEAQKAEKKMNEALGKKRK